MEDSVMEERLRQMDKEIAEISQGKHPTIRRGDVMAVTRMKEEYRKKGLSVYWQGVNNG